MTYGKIMIIKLVCTFSAVMGVAFSAHAMEKKQLTTYSKKQGSTKAVSADTLFDIKLPSYSSSLTKKTETSKNQTAAEKKAIAAEKKAKEQQKIQAQIDKKAQELNQKFAEADEFELTVKLCSASYLKRQQWLHNQFLSSSADKESRQQNKQSKTKDKQGVPVLLEIEDNYSDHMDQVVGLGDITNNITTKKTRGRPAISKQQRVLNNTPEDLQEKLIYFVKEKQVGLVLDMLFDPIDGEKLRKQSLLAKRLYDINTNQYAGMPFKYGKVVPKVALDYVALGMAKKAEPVNAGYIHNYLENSAIKSVKKEANKTQAKLGLKQPQCFGWEFGCKDGKECNHSVDVNGAEYKRYFKLSMNGADILKEQAPFTRALVKSARMQNSLLDFIKQSEEHRQYSNLYQSLIGSDEAKKVQQDWTKVRSDLTLKWAQANKNISYKKLADLYPNKEEIIKKDKQYGISIVVPTQKSLMQQPARTSLVSLAEKNKDVTELSYGHSPFTKIE